MIDKNKFLCIIPARIGSKGVPKKNIKIINGKPLIYYSIKIAQESKYIGKIIVSSDSQEVLNTAKSFGVDTPFLRPKELATDTSLDIDYITHTLNYLKTNERYVPNYIILLRPTTPIRDVNIVDSAIKKLISNNDASGLRSTHEVAESPFKWFVIKDDYYAPICDKYTLSDTNNPRQSFPNVYLPNGYIDIIKLEELNNNLYGEKILNFVTPVSYEIDTLEDFEYIQYLMLKDN